jgi:hypothetical protein
MRQQKEPPRERMRRMYSCAVEVEVEDKSGRLERLVENSMHFRTMTVREARSRSLSCRQLRMSRYLNSSNPWFDLFGKLAISRSSNCPESRPLPKPSEPKMIGFNRSCDQFVQCLEWRVAREVHACATWNPFGIKYCRHGRFEMSADLGAERFLYKRGNRLIVLATLISLSLH